MEAEIRLRLEARAPEMVSLLRRWVSENTGTWNRSGLEAQAEELVSALQRLGFDVEIRAGEPIELPGAEGRVSGPLLIARREASESSAGAPRFLLIGHYDTVFEPSSPFQSMQIPKADSGRAVGPGVADMKGGIVVMLFALSELGLVGELERGSWTVLLNSDEEIGSLLSRPYIEREARAADLGFVFEAASPEGAMVQSRRGLGQFHLSVQGVAAHAGHAHRKGRSAIRELAAKVLRIEALTDLERGISLNVGTIRGGTKRNIVPAHAEAWIDLRYDAVEQGKATRAELERITAKSFVEGTSSRLWGRLHRPPKRLTPETRRLIDAHARVASDLDLHPPAPVHAGGGTDGSLTSAVGLPTLDSMGVRGGEMHTDREFVVLESLPERAAIAAILLRRLLRSRFTRSDGPGRVSASVFDGDRWAPAGGEIVNPVRSGRKQR